MVQEPKSLITFSDRLKHAMEAAGYVGYGAPAKLARDLRVTPKAVAKWLNGDSTPTNSNIEHLAKVLNVGYYWLLIGIKDFDEVMSGIFNLEALVDKGTAPARQQADTESALQDEEIPISAWDDDTPLDDDEVEVPFLREVELAAGSGRTVIQESTRSKLRFGKLTLRKHSVQFDQAVCVPVHGNSMEPVLPDGSTVAINRGSTQVVDGKIYAIAHGGLLRVKTLYRLPSGGIRMRSFNRDEHPDEEYSSTEMEEFEIKILGRVFWSAAFH
jgi:phage repressor protein C with HTH and peptisase S24 domain